MLETRVLAVGYPEMLLMFLPLLLLSFQTEKSHMLSLHVTGVFVSFLGVDVHRDYLFLHL